MPKFTLLACLLALSFSSFADAAPTINSISDSKIVDEGSAHSLTVQSIGDGTLSYQWMKADVPITGATSATLSFPAITLTDIGRYAVNVSDADGSTMSPTVLVDVNPAFAPYFNDSPSETTFNIGGSFHISRSPSGSQPISFQWFHDGIKIPGATGSSFSNNFATAEDSGVYTLTSTNFKGSATSRPITVRAVEVAPPVITSQPRSLVIIEGDSSSVNFGYYSSINISIELLRDGIVMGNFGSSVSFSNVTLNSAGEYRLRISNQKGAVTSEAFNVYVERASPVTASINGPNGPVQVGEQIRLRNNSYNTSGNTFQWFKNGAPVAGAQSDDLYIYSATVSDAGSYHLEISRAGLTSKSNAIAVSMSGSADLVISHHPSSISYEPKTYNSIGVTISPSGDYQHVWTRDGIALPGQSGRTLELGSYSAAEVFGTYRVSVTHEGETLTSDPAIVSPLPLLAPQITNQPGNRSVVDGHYSSLSVSVSASPTPTYQWFQNEVAIEGATSRNLSFSPAQLSDAGVYHIEVTNSAGTATSESATVSVVGGAALSAPMITNHPDSISLRPGHNSNLQVSVSGDNNNLSYQWFQNDVPVSDSNNRYLHRTGEPRYDGQYHVVVTHAEGSITSEKATLRTYLTSELPPILSSTGSRANFAGNSVYFQVYLRNDIYNPQVLWRKDGELIPETRYNSIHLSASATNEGIYTAEVIHQGGTFISPPMRLESIGEASSTSALAFEYEPASIALFPGSSGELRSYAPYAESYQWFKNNLPVPLTTQSNLSFAYATPESSGSYHVVATNASGSITSDFATVTILDGRAPFITRHPASHTLDSLNGNSSFSVSASSDSPMNYQWFFDGVAITGANSHYFNSRNQSAGDYYVEATNASGTTQSLAATLRYRTPSAPPSIIENPRPLVRRLGEFASFTAKGSGSGDLAYQWYHNNTAISGANGSQHTISSVTSQHAGIYTLILTNQSGAASSQGVALTIVADTAPTITQHPTSRTLDAGLSTTFAVIAQGVPAPSYQWLRNGVAVFGAVNSTLRLNNVQRTQTGAYAVQVTNSAGSIRSHPAQLSLTQTNLPIAGRHHAAGNGYTASESLTIVVRLSYANDIASFGYQVLLPDGWSYVSSTATNTVSAPQTGDQSLLEWAWADLPAGPLEFTFTIQAPENLTGTQEFAALIVARRDNQDFEALVNPDPLLVDSAVDHHTADLNRDGKIGLSELLRVIELYNTRHQTSRTGRYTPSADTPDGFTPEATQPDSVDIPLARYHLGDMDRDGKIGLSELLRVIELYNTRAASTRTGTYHRAPETPDGFAPGTGE